MRMRQICQTALIVGVVLLVFFLLKSPAYVSTTENFEVTGGEVIRWIGAAVLGIFAGWLLYMFIGWLLSKWSARRFDSYGRPTYYTPSSGYQ